MLLVDDHTIVRQGLKEIDATWRSSTSCRDTRIIGLSMYEEADRAEAMRKAGAVSYLSKVGPLVELLAAVRKST